MLNHAEVTAFKKQSSSLLHFKPWLTTLTYIALVIEIYLCMPIEAPI